VAEAVQKLLATNVPSVHASVSPESPIAVALATATAVAR
jgi:hypothetical protein